METRLNFKAELFLKCSKVNFKAGLLFPLRNLILCSSNANQPKVQPHNIMYVTF